MEQLTFTKVVIDGSCEKGSIIKGIPKWAADKDIAREGCAIKPRAVRPGTRQSSFGSRGSKKKGKDTRYHQQQYNTVNAVSKQ